MRVPAIVLTLAVGVAMAGHASAAQTTKPATKATATHGSISGKLESYDPATRMLKIKAGKGEQQITLASNAVVHQGAKTLTVDDLAAQQGHDVKVRYTVANNEKTADSVTIAAAPRRGTQAKRH
jgi:hypothetical protein